MGPYDDLIVHNASNTTDDNKRTGNYADITFDNRNNCNSLEGLDNLKSGSVCNFNGNNARALPTGSMEARTVSFDNVIEEVKLRSRSKARSSFQIKAQSCDSFLNTSQLKYSTHDTNAVHIGQTFNKKCSSQLKTSKICTSKTNICDTTNERNSVDNVIQSGPKECSGQVMDTGVKSKEICSSQKKTPIKFCEWAPKEGIDTTVPLYNTVSAYSVRGGGSHDKLGGVQPGSSYESAVSARGFRPSAAVVRSAVSAGQSCRKPRLHTGDGRSAATEEKSLKESHKGGSPEVSVSGVSTSSLAAMSSHQSLAAVSDSKRSVRSSQSKRQGAEIKATEVGIEPVTPAPESMSKEAEESQSNPERNTDELPRTNEHSEKNATEGIQARESPGPRAADNSSQSENGKSSVLDGDARSRDSGEYLEKEPHSPDPASAKSSQPSTEDQPESSTSCSSHSLVDMGTRRIAVDDNNVTAVRSLPNFTNVSNDSPYRRQTSESGIDRAPPSTGRSRVAQLVQSFSGREREVEETGQPRTPVTSRPPRSPVGKGVASTAARFGSQALTCSRSPAQTQEEQQARSSHPSKKVL